MKRFATTLSAGALLALGCGTSSQTAPPAAAPTTSQRAEAPVVASYEQRSDDHGSSHHVEHHGEHRGDHEGNKAKAEGPMADAMALLEAGDYDAAAAQFAALTQSQPENPQAWLMHGYALHAGGRLDEALAVHQRAASFEAIAPTALYNVACVHALQGRIDDAFAALGRAADAGFAGVEHAAKDSDLASLRADPRFAAFAQRAEANLATKKRNKMHGEH